MLWHLKATSSSYLKQEEITKNDYTLWRQCNVCELLTLQAKDEIICWITDMNVTCMLLAHKIVTLDSDAVVLLVISLLIVEPPACYLKSQVMRRCNTIALSINKQRRRTEWSSLMWYCAISALKGLMIKSCIGCSSLFVTRRPSASHVWESRVSAGN